MSISIEEALEVTNELDGAGSLKLTPRPGFALNATWAEKDGQIQLVGISLIRVTEMVRPIGTDAELLNAALLASQKRRAAGETILTFVLSAHENPSPSPTQTLWGFPCEVSSGVPINEIWLVYSDATGKQERQVVTLKDVDALRVDERKNRPEQRTLPSETLRTWKSQLYRIANPSVQYTEDLGEMKTRVINENCRLAEELSNEIEEVLTPYLRADKESR